MAERVATPSGLTDEEARKKLAEALPSLTELERELCKRSLHYFATKAFAILEPDRPFEDNWHLVSICEHLQAVSEGRLLRLIINVPPRHMKSLLVSVIWPAWDWISKPSRQFLTASHERQLATRDALKARQLIESPWYRGLFGDVFQLGKDQNEKRRYENDKKGRRIAISQGTGVGEGGDILIADDPQNTDKMTSEPYVESSTSWWNGTFMQRLNNPKTAAVVLTMQRLAENDLCAEALKEGDWVHLMFPAEFEPARRCVTPLGVQDPRTVAGELLWPSRMPMSELKKQKKRLGAYGIAGQLQQRPAPIGGGIIKTDKVRKIRRKDLPEFFHYLLSWDTAATEDIDNNDPTGMTVWGLSIETGKSGMFKLGQLEEWLTAPDLEARIPQEGRMWPHGAEHLIEAAGPTGLAMIQILRVRHPAMVITAADPKKLGGNKSARAHLAAVYVENGLVWVIDEEDDPQTEGFLSGLGAFPKCDPRDVEDSAVQAIIHGCTTYTFESEGDYFYESSSTEGRVSAETVNDDENW